MGLHDKVLSEAKAMLTPLLPKKPVFDDSSVSDIASSSSSSAGAAKKSTFESFLDKGKEKLTTLITTDADIFVLTEQKDAAKYLLKIIEAYDKTAALDVFKNSLFQFSKVRRACYAVASDISPSGDVIQKAALIICNAIRQSTESQIESFTATEWVVGAMLKEIFEQKQNNEIMVQVSAPSFYEMATKDNGIASLFPHTSKQDRIYRHYYYSNSLPLMTIAARYGWGDVITMLLDEGYTTNPPDQHDPRGTPLWYAMNRGFWNIAKILIEHDAPHEIFDKKNNNQATFKHLAQLHSQNVWKPFFAAILKKLKSKTPDIIDSLLYIAVCDNQPKVAITCIQNGADLSKKFEEYGDGNILHVAVRKDDIWAEVINFALNENPDIVNVYDVNGYTPLHAAILCNPISLAMISSLASSKNIDKTKNTTKNNKSAVALAIRRENPSIILLLIKSGFNASETYDGETLLEISKTKQWHELTVALTPANRASDSQKNEGMTPAEMQQRLLAMEEKVEIHEDMLNEQAKLKDMLNEQAKLIQQLLAERKPNTLNRSLSSPALFSGSAKSVTSITSINNAGTSDKIKASNKIDA
ncbi:MAG: hypothetical protein ACHQAX_05930 [Gammaproteobacteria bacterium]